ncbi:MAG: MGMT family protein [Candidatus Berkelbacteria bacterium]|nr:MGMT family protein [Candidatus Berkelbacteria bacterium]
MFKKKSWREKLNDSKDLPKVVKLNDTASQHWHGHSMAIPAPIEVDALMKKVPKGKLTTIDEIRKKVAKKHGTDIGCPLTCGIFSWIAANAAGEEMAEGKKDITPFWRTLKSNGELNPKYPGGVEFQSDQLKSESFEIDTSHKIPRVKDFEKYLV